MTTRPRAIIFDFNGVIIDDYEVQKEAWSQMSQLLRGKPITHDEMVSHVRGIPTEDIVAWMSPGLTEQQIAEQSARKSALAKELFSNSALFKLTPGLSDFLDELMRRNIPRIIATSQTRGTFIFLAERLGLQKWFTIEQSICYDGTYPGKPAPDAYVLAARALSVSPAECIVIEDAQSGIVSAYAAGVRNIVAIGRDQQLNVLRELPGVVKTVHDFSELNLKQLF